MGTGTVPARQDCFFIVQSTQEQADMKLKFKSLTLAAVALVGFAAPSWAAIITHSFDVVITGAGSNFDGTYSGTFSYDSSSITPGATNSATGLLTDLSFALWGGVTYDESTANTGYLGFDSQGNLNDVLFGTDCGAGTCSAPAGTAPSGNWYFSWSSAGNNGTAFLGHNIGSGDLNLNSIFNGATSVSEGRTVPEPGTLALLAVGAMGAAALRRRRVPSKA